MYLQGNDTMDSFAAQQVADRTLHGGSFEGLGLISHAVIRVKNQISGWPLVGNEGINLYIGILGIHSLIPY